MPAAGFYISPHNPNAEQGGGDLVTPTHQTVDVEGPWVVFPAVDVAEAQGSVPLPHAALPMSVVRQILAEQGHLQVRADETGGEGDIRDKIVKPRDEDTSWEDLPVEDQNKLASQFAPGTRVKTQYGTTTVPADETYVPQFPVKGSPDDDEDAALAQIDAELPLEEPDANGGYSPPADADPEPAEDAPTI